jgi:hypothetical protein
VKEACLSRPADRGFYSRDFLREFSEKVLGLFSCTPMAGDLRSKTMIPNVMKKLAMMMLVASMAFAIGGCATMKGTLAKSPPAPDDPSADLAGGFPQH